MQHPQTMEISCLSTHYYYSITTTEFAQLIYIEFPIYCALFLIQKVYSKAGLSKCTRCQDTLQWTLSKGRKNSLHGPCHKKNRQFLKGTACRSVCFNQYVIFNLICFDRSVLISQFKSIGFHRSVVILILQILILVAMISCSQTCMIKTI